MLDLSTLDTSQLADEGVDMPLRHFETREVLKNGDAPITLRLLGNDGERFQENFRALLSRRMKEAPDKVDPERADDDAIDLLVASTVGWSGIVVEGKEMAFTPANAKALYRRFKWIREQAEAFVARRANFIPRPSTI